MSNECMKTPEQLSAAGLEEVMRHFAAYGQNPDGSISRVFGSPFYTEAAEEMCRYMAACGLDSRIDSVGNVYGVLPGTDPEAGEILILSHLDTVKEGGIFDGLLGVVAGIECAKRLQAEGKKLRFALHVIATNGEEGNELGGTFGSRCLAGKLDLTPAFLEKAAKYGYTEQALRDSRMDFSAVKDSIELHIEQGRTLFESGEEIGIVTGIVGLQRYIVTIEGRSNHAGTTMMEYRRDALVKMSELICYADSLAREIGKDLVCTFSKVEIHPNALAVINDGVTMVLECRNREEAVMDVFVQQVRDRFETGEDAPVKVCFSPMVRKAPVDCDEKLVELGSKVCREMNAAFRVMPSGATHDGNMIALRAPIGMIFVPSVEGISHSGDEWTDWAQCEKGVEVLYRMLEKM